MDAVGRDLDPNEIPGWRADTLLDLAKVLTAVRSTKSSTKASCMAHIDAPVFAHIEIETTINGQPVRCRVRARNTLPISCGRNSN